MKASSKSRVRLKILKRRISNFITDFTSSRLGVLGAVMLVVFVMIGVLAPMITPYDPQATMLAYKYSKPLWVKIFPQYSDLPETFFSQINFSISEDGKYFDVGYVAYDPEINEMLPNATSILKIKYKGGVVNPVELKMIWNFMYNYAPPPVIQFNFRWRVIDLQDMGYNIEFSLIKLKNGSVVEYSLWDSNYKLDKPLKDLSYRYTYPYERWLRLVEVRSDYDSIRKRLSRQIGVEDATVSQIMNQMFDEKGSYAVVLTVRLKPKSATASAEVDVVDFKFGWLGTAHGLLGTDHEGADVFSRVLAGTRVSLVIGLMVAVISTAVGTVVGLVAGYFGGFLDEVSMRIVDVLLCLPILPLLLALISIFGRNLYLIMLLIIMFTWMGLARTVRSQVLQLREMAFVEAAIAAGATKRNILFRHILPNVTPLVMTSMMLSIPGAILTEAALSFLGFGDPNMMTWGRMINQAMNFGGFQNLAWWWIFSPAVAIIFLCVSFVFISHALDKVLNPRIRMRR